MPSNRAHSHDSNDIHFTSLPILEGEIRHLPVISLHFFTRKPLRVWIRRLRDMGTSFHRGRRQIPERPPSDQIQDIAGFQIRSPFFWPFPLARLTSSLNSTTIWTVWDMFLG